MSNQPPNNDPWQQPTPNTNYPPQYNYPPPPPTGTKKPMSKGAKYLLLAFAFLLTFVCGVASGASGRTSQQASVLPTPTTDTSTATDTPIPTATLDTSIATSTPAPTQPPPPPAKWTTVQSFKGNGTKKTAIFTVPDDWKINWSCNGQGYGVDGVLGVIVYGSDNSYIDGAVNATCKAGTSRITKDSTEEHTSGDVYLSVNATGDWSIQVQVFK